MSFTGVSITIHALGGLGGGRGEHALPRAPRWSEHFSAGTKGVTKNTVPNASEKLGALISTSKDIFVAVGYEPDASQAASTSRDSTRFLVRAGSDFTIYVDEGDRIAWAEA